MTSPTPLQLLATRLAMLQPRSLLCLGSGDAGLFVGLDADGPAGGDQPVGNAIERGRLRIRHNVHSVADLAGETRYDCALLADFLEHLPRVDGIAVLGRLCNLHAGRLLVFIDHAASRDTWTLDDFISLGFRHDADLVGESGGQSRRLSLYSYDIASYNHERTWNNPRFWANPELWGKYFW